jgi:hypothetical protein
VVVKGPKFEGRVAKKVVDMLLNGYDAPMIY